MTNLVKKAIDENSMLCGVKEVIVALSGGADSVCLLHIMLALSKEYSFKLSAAHLNHSLRGEESERDMEFCKSLCKAQGIPLTVKTVCIREYAQKNKQSTELAAREKRYEFFKELVNDGIVVATAHTASDNLETVLLNLTRGTALSGLCGIPPKRDCFIRPLLYCTRSDVEEFCRSNNLEYVTDSSNLSDDYTRNVIRHKVVPVLKSINASVESGVINTAVSLRADSKFLNTQASTVFNTAYFDGTLDAEIINNSDQAVATRVIAKYLSKSGGEVSYTTVNRIYGLIGTDFERFSLKGDIYCYCKNRRLFIGKDRAQNPKFSVSIEKTEIKYLKKTQKINSLFLNNAFDYDKIAGEPVIRTRLPGDEIKLVARPKKTLKKLYNECKIPEHIRENLPVIADSKGVIWVMGIGVAERVRVDDNSQNIAVIRI